MRILFFLLAISLFAAASVDKTEESTLIPGQTGRVLFLPGGSMGVFFTGNEQSRTTLLIDSDIEYQAGVVTLFGNAGLGFAYDRFQFQFQGGFKYKLPYIAPNLKPLLKAGISFNPITSCDGVTLFSGFLGGGFQYFFQDYHGIEITIDFHGGSFIGADLGAFYTRVRTSWIMVF